MRSCEVKDRERELCEVLVATAKSQSEQPLGDFELVSICRLVC